MKKRCIIISVILLAWLTGCSSGLEAETTHAETETSAVSAAEEDTAAAEERTTPVNENDLQVQEFEKYGIRVKVINEYLVTEIRSDDICIEFEYYEGGYFRKSKCVNGVVTEYELGVGDSGNLLIAAETGENGRIEYIYECDDSGRLAMPADILKGFVYEGKRYYYREEYPYTYIIDEHGNEVAGYYCPEDGPVQETNYTDDKIGEINHMVGGALYDKEIGLYSGRSGILFRRPDGSAFVEKAQYKLVEYLAEYWGLK